MSYKYVDNAGYDSNQEQKLLKEIAEEISVVCTTSNNLKIIYYV